MRDVFENNESLRGYLSIDGYDNYLIMTNGDVLQWHCDAPYIWKDFVDVCVQLIDLFAHDNSLKERPFSVEDEILTKNLECAFKFPRNPLLRIGKNKYRVYSLYRFYDDNYDMRAIKFDCKKYIVIVRVPNEKTYNEILGRTVQNMKLIELNNFPDVLIEMILNN